jgi:phosphoribosylanthranilate isomerase
MIKVKICGIKNDYEINYLNNSLPDYAGFVFAESKRKVSEDKAKELSSSLNGSIKRVGVFVNEKLDRIIKITNNVKLDVVQLHGEEDNNYILSLKENVKAKIWKAIRVNDIEDIENLREINNTDAYLLDTYSKDSYGGTGKSFDWNLALKAKKFGNIILAGGLNIENVGKAVNKVSPFAVDVSSGVENENGKDEYKVKKFVYHARSNIY